MKEALVHFEKPSSLTTSLHDIAIPSPKPSQLLIRVVVSGSNPKDWKIPVNMPDYNSTNSGDDIAGIVESVGSEVTEFKAGDRVAAFHEMRSAHGSFAEYAIAEAKASFHLPANISFEDGATIPLAGMTAAIGLFCRLGLPEPWSRDAARRAKCKGGVVVYGAAGAVGAFAVKLLRQANIHPIICVAGNGIPFVEGLIDREKGDVIVDYRQGNEAVVKGLREGVVPGEKLFYAFDAVSEKGSYTNICQVLEKEGGQMAVVLPGKKYEGIPEGVKLSQTMVGTTHGPDADFAFAWFRLFGVGLKEGWFTAHPYTVVPGGLNGVQTGLNNLRDGKASATKYVFRIADTDGLEKSHL